MEHEEHEEPEVTDMTDDPATATATDERPSTGPGAGAAPTADMRAAVHDRYGPPEVLRIERVLRPVPAAGEVLVEVHASTVNRSDTGFRSARPWVSRAFSGWRRPKHRVTGAEFAGVVVEVAADVADFVVGDRVFGVNGETYGAHAEYMTMRAAGAIVRLPDGVTFDEGAAMCDGMVLADTYVSRSALAPGRSVCIYGASGSIGTAAVQLAAVTGARVTAVCTAETMELVRSLGADEVYDHRAVDFTTLGRQWDVIIDAVGKRSFRQCRRSLSPGGVYFNTDLGYLWSNPLVALATKVLPGRNAPFPLPVYRKDRIERLAALVAEGRYRAVIDRRVPLDQIVAASHHVETATKIGNVVITVRE